MTRSPMASTVPVRRTPSSAASAQGSTHRFAYDLLDYHDEATAAVVLVGRSATTGEAVRARLLEFAGQVEAAGSVRMAEHARRVAAEIPVTTGALA